MRMKATAERLVTRMDIACKRRTSTRSRVWDDVELTDDGRPVTYHGRARTPPTSQRVYETEGGGGGTTSRRREPAPELR